VKKRREECALTEILLKAEAVPCASRRCQAFPRLFTRRDPRSLGSKNTRRGAFRRITNLLKKTFLTHNLSSASTRHRENPPYLEQTPIVHLPTHYRLLSFPQQQPSLSPSLTPYQSVVKYNSPGAPPWLASFTTPITHFKMSIFSIYLDSESINQTPLSSCSQADT